MTFPAIDFSDSPALKVLILGARGQLGSLLCAGAPAGVDVIALASSALDIRDPAALAEQFRQSAPDVVINAAAYTQVDRAESEPEQAYAVNQAGVRNIIEASAASAGGKASRIIHVSTDFVFDGTATRPYRPDDETSPLGIYGLSKLGGEQELLSRAPARSCIIRTAWLYAAEGKNFVNTMLNLMNTRDSLSVVNDQRGTPTSAHALAAAIWHFVGQPQLHGVFHWTDAGEATWYDFACEIQALGLRHGLLDRKIPIQPIPTSAFPTPARRPAYSVLDKTQTWQALGLTSAPWQLELEQVLAAKARHGKADA